MYSCLIVNDFETKSDGFKIKTYDNASFIKKYNLK